MRTVQAGSIGRVALELSQMLEAQPDAAMGAGRHGLDRLGRLENVHVANHGGSSFPPCTSIGDAMAMALRSAVRVTSGSSRDDFRPVWPSFRSDVAATPIRSRDLMEARRPVR